ncbi:E3 ubiquitin-protein ligase XIAP isoform X2 [Amia ocellicauda]|uniref:E3 ubiquitin-protein ligase XIAP isoform X2 n=1 Tax=Amia ocellicauda TaxID=2972642 RepID=UPI0034638588
MASSQQETDIEADHSMDMSGLVTRIESFQNFPRSDLVSPQRLARAGFYYTGEADRVQCFSCRQTVDNWRNGDAPAERHQQVSPQCTYLSCTHRLPVQPPLLNGSLSTRYGDVARPLPNGSAYDEEAEDLEYRLRTGEVVDNTAYPRHPRMCREDERLKTFATWPSGIRIRPRDLAQAGLFYLGTGDRVQCFCCGGVLGGWDPEDEAWKEHERHFPNCFFILGHEVNNVPSEPAPENPRSPAAAMELYEERLRSYQGLKHPIAPERLAQAGFYYRGVEDRVTCFNCNGGLKDWQPDEDPWEEHAKYYPGCSFLLSEKGQEFVNSVQLRDARGQLAADSFENGPSRQERDEDPLEKLRKLQREKQCKICMDRDIAVVFIPCGHLVTCKRCSESVSKCPICCAQILQKVKTYIS